MLSCKNYILKHVLDFPDCPQTETQHVSDILNGKVYVVEDLGDMLNDLAP